MSDTFKAISFLDKMADAYVLLQMEIAEVWDAASYELATSFCSNCPRSSRSDEWDHVPEICCKERDDYQQEDEEYVEKCTAVKAAILELLGTEKDDYLQAATARLNKKADPS
jgi:hypothetical protein